MPEEHSPVPAKQAHQSHPVKPETVKELADAIAGQIAAQQALGADMSGDFKVDIVYNNVEYTLTVESPRGGEDDAGFWIAKGERTDLTTKKTAPFLDCSFKDADNWTVGLGLPVPITFTNGEIKELWGSFTMGTPAPPTSGDRPGIES